MCIDQTYRNFKSKLQFYFHVFLKLYSTATLLKWKVFRFGEVGFKLNVKPSVFTVSTKFSGKIDENKVCCNVSILKNALPTIKSEDDFDGTTSTTLIFVVTCVLW